MEASGAGLAAGGDAGGQQQGQAAGGDGGGQQGAGDAAQAGQQQTSEATIAQMAETLQGLAGTQEEMRQFLATQAEAGAAAADAATQQQEQPKPADLSFLDESSPQYDPEQAAARFDQVMREAAGSEAQRLMQEQLAPLQQQVADMRTEREADTLMGEFPELGKPEVAAEAMKTVELAAEQIGRPELAGNAQFVRYIYMAGRAAELAQKQDGASGAGVATLEGAGGASPGGADQGAEAAANAIGERWAGRTNVLAKL